jgi:hypothetical protein
MQTYVTDVFIQVNSMESSNEFLNTLWIGMERPKNYNQFCGNRYCVLYSINQAKEEYKM